MKRVSWINLLVGIWLLIAPFALNAITHPTTAANAVIVGFLLIATSWWILAVTAPSAGAAWFQVLCGVWLIAAPYALRDTNLHAFTGNDILMGSIAVVVGLITVRALVRPAMPA